MSIQPGCIPCIVKQAHNFAKMVGISDSEIHKQILYDTMNKLLEHKNIKTAPHFSIILQSIIGKYINVTKAYHEIKQKNLKIAMK